MGGGSLRLASVVEAFQHPDSLVGHCIGVVVAVEWADFGASVPVIEPLHDVGGALQHVDRLFVERRVGADEVDLGDGPSTVQVVHHEVVRADRAEAHAVRRVGIGGPVPAVAGAQQDPLFLEQVQQRFEVFPAKGLPLLERELEGGALHVLDEDLEVVGIDESLFRARSEEVVGVPDHELVLGGRVGHEHGGRRSAPAPRAPRLLPGRGDGARIPGDHRRVQPADVDSQLQGVR